GSSTSSSTRENANQARSLASSSPAPSRLTCQPSVWYQQQRRQPKVPTDDQETQSFVNRGTRPLPNRTMALVRSGSSLLNRFLVNECEEHTHRIPLRNTQRICCQEKLPGSVQQCLEYLSDFCMTRSRYRRRALLPAHR